MRGVRRLPTARQFALEVAVLPKRGGPPGHKRSGSNGSKPGAGGMALSAEELPRVQACLEAISRGSRADPHGGTHHEIESGRLPRTAQLLQVSKQV